jgi:hypothetical protein
MSAAGSDVGPLLEDVDLGCVAGLEGLTQSPLKLLVVQARRFEVVEHAGDGVGQEQIDVGHEA